MAKTFLERYQNGETKEVYDEIARLGKKCFNEEYYSENLKVLHESCKRVAYNLDVIYGELLKIDYNFCQETRYNWQRPLLRPLPDTDKLLLQLDNLVKPYFVPESLKMFYKVVGACNFAWDYNRNDDIPWLGADPIQIIPLNDLLSELTWSEIPDHEPWEKLILSADYFHKDNISGGSPYCIENTPEPSIDSLFVNEEHETTFIDYLRITFENCGFSRAEYIDDDSLSEFIQKVRPRLLSI